MPSITLTNTQKTDYPALAKLVTDFEKADHKLEIYQDEDSKLDTFLVMFRFKIKMDWVCNWLKYVKLSNGNEYIDFTHSYSQATGKRKAGFKRKWKVEAYLKRINIDLNKYGNQS